MRHVTDGHPEACWCLPRVEVVDGSLLVIHNDAPSVWRRLRRLLRR